MTFMHSALCAVTIGAVIGLPTATASPQTPSQPPSHDHGGLAQAVPERDVAARLASLDARIFLLRADMMMFTGELKIQAMASLLDALVERQSLTDHEMQRMRGRMMERMMTPPEAVRPDWPEEESPEALCSPYI